MGEELMVGGSTPDDLGPRRLGVVATDPSLSPHGGLLEGARLAKVGLLLFDRLAIANIGRLSNLDTGLRSIPDADSLEDLVVRLTCDDAIGSDEILRGILTGPDHLRDMHGRPLRVAALFTATSNDQILDVILRDYRDLKDAGILDQEPLPAMRSPSEPVPIPDELPGLDVLLGKPGATKQEIERDLDHLMSRLVVRLRRGDSPSAGDQETISNLGVQLRRSFWDAALRRLPRGTGVISQFPNDPDQANLQRDLAGALGTEVLLEALPLLPKLTVPDLLSLLEDLSTPILRFRLRVREASKQLTILDEETFVEFWEDVVRPDLAALDQDLKQARQVGQYLLELDSAVVTAAACSLALFLTGPAGLAAMLAKSAPLVVSGARLLMRRQRNLDEVARSHDFYVLHHLRELQ